MDLGLPRSPCHKHRPRRPPKQPRPARPQRARCVTELCATAPIDEDHLREEVEAAVARVAANQDRVVTDRYQEAIGRAASGVGDVLAGHGLADTVTRSGRPRRRPCCGGRPVFGRDRLDRPTRR
jgi:hypothetical protein